MFDQIYQKINTFHTNLNTFMANRALLRKTLLNLCFGLFITTSTTVLLAFVVPIFIPYFFFTQVAATIFYLSMALSFIAAFAMSFARDPKWLRSFFMILCSSQGYMLGFFVTVFLHTPGGAAILTIALISTLTALITTTVLAYLGYFDNMLNLNITAILLTLFFVGLINVFLGLPLLSFIHSAVATVVFCFVLGIDFARSMAYTNENLNTQYIEPLSILLAANILLDLINLFVHTASALMDGKNMDWRSAEVVASFVIVALIAIPYALWQIGSAMVAWCSPAVQRQERQNDDYSPLDAQRVVTARPIDPANGPRLDQDSDNRIPVATLCEQGDAARVTRVATLVV